MSEQLLKAVQDIWAAAPRCQGLWSSPELVKVIDACGHHTESKAALFGNNFAFINALKALGLPSYGSTASEPVDFESVTSQLIAACTSTTQIRTHYCPLDLADDWPELAFGNAAVRSFTRAELAIEFGAKKLAAHSVGADMDLDRLSMVQWLVVKEPYTVVGSPARRSGLFLEQPFEIDLGAVEPHQNEWPQVVQDALFFLLLAPWEDWVPYTQRNLFGFEIPWIHTVESDIFISPVAPPIPDKLSVYPHLYNDPEGNEYERDRAEQIFLDAAATTDLVNWNSDSWQQLEQAKTSPLFKTPIQHFLIRGFQSTGIDQLLAHITVIEAAVGIGADYQRRLRTTYADLGATRRVGVRLAGLIGDAQAATQYAELFDLRSAFVHGRADLKPISALQRRCARSLARRAACALVANVESRETVLEKLLDVGADLLGVNVPR